MVVRRSRAILLAVATFVAGVMIGAAVERPLSEQGRYEPGFARIEGCHVESDDRTMTCGTAVGAGDILLGVDVSEETTQVSVVAHASVFVPGRGMFKNLSASLDTRRLVLAHPLAGRRIVDGASGKLVSLY